MRYFVTTETGRCTAPINYATLDDAEDARRAFEQILGVPCRITKMLVKPLDILR